MTQSNGRPALEMISVVTAGHVDHGKSTVVGRLLADAGALPKGKLEQVRQNCLKNSKPFEYAFLLDALKAEQAQGITIDTARCFFDTDKRHYILIDAPGHLEFLKNMVTGASRAEAALLVIDASRGVEENTRRHGYFLSMLGIRQISILVNKMDLVDYKQSAFDDIRREYQAFLKKIDVEPVSFIPVSGAQGDNIASRSDRIGWYKGVCVLEQLDAFKSVEPPERMPLRMPVQGVYKFTARGDSRRIVAGAVESGHLCAGDRVVFLPSGKKSTVKSLECFNAPTPQRFSIGQAAGFTLTDQIFIQRAEVVCKEGETPPHVGVRVRVNLFWLGKSPLTPDSRCLLKCATARVPVRLERVIRIVNAADLSRRDRQYVEKNEVAQCDLLFESPIAFDVAGGCDALSRFVLVDNYEISGGGIITDALKADDYDLRNIRWSPASLTEQQRTDRQGRFGLVVWMTGLSGSGKTTLANEAERRLVEEGIPAFVLDGDRLRRGLNADLGFSAGDRQENIRRTMHVADLFRAANIVTLVTLISPFRAAREEARKLIGDRFVEVYVKASLDTCRARDPKGLYQKAQSGELQGFTGIDSPYEAPQAPDLLLDTDVWDEVECSEMLVRAILSRLGRA
jgi:bifunctional enzyme CysN/CysC